VAAGTCCYNIDLALEERMRKSQIALIGLLSMVLFTIVGCSHVGEDWKAAQTADTTEAYQDFLRQHPDSEYGVAAQERVRQLAEDRDWQQASKADTLDAYQQFVAVHADGKWAQEARVRIENFQLSAGGQSPPSMPGTESAASAAPAATAPAAASTSPAKPAVSPKAATSSSSASAAGSGAKHYAQLGAYSSKSSAEAAWHKLSGQFPTQLKSLQPHYAAATGASAKPVVRLQVSLPSTQRTHELCAELKKKSQACLPIS
jgi:cell division protein FtsN